MDLGEFGDREKEGKRGEATSEGKKESSGKAIECAQENMKAYRSPPSSSASEPNSTLSLIAYHVGVARVEGGRDRGCHFGGRRKERG